jgi:hypothetical protein
MGVRTQQFSGATMWRSRADFEKDLARSYRHAKIPVDKNRIAIGSALLVYGAKGRKKSLPKNAATAFGILDTLISDAIIWHHSMALLFMQRLENARRPFDQALMALFMRVSQDSIVVQHLIAKGYDVQARNLLRSIDEHTDTIYYLCLRPEACSEFVATEDEKSANEFWYKHIIPSFVDIDSSAPRRG